jgi:hypothetical protein
MIWYHDSLVTESCFHVMDTIIWSAFVGTIIYTQNPRHCFTRLLRKQVHQCHPLSLKGFEWIYPVFHHEYINKHQTNVIKTHMIA